MEVMDVNEENDIPLSDRLKIRKDEKIDLIPTPLLRKYISYARKYVQPR